MDPHSKLFKCFFFFAYFMMKPYELHLGFRSMDIFADLDLEPTDPDPEHEHWQKFFDLTLKPDLTATLKAPKTAAAPPQSCFIPGIAVLG